jgi:hypothetical protein
LLVGVEVGVLTQVLVVEEQVALVGLELGLDYLLPQELHIR